MTNDPTALALRLMEAIAERANRRHLGEMVQRALSESAYAPEVVEVATGLAVDAEVATTVGAKLGWVLYDAGDACPDGVQAGRLLAASAILRELHEDPQVTVETAIAALRRDPGNADAREIFVRLAQEPDEAPVYADAMESLAEAVVAGEFPREVFLEMLHEARALDDQLELARSILRDG